MVCYSQGTQQECTCTCILLSPRTSDAANTGDFGTDTALPFAIRSILILQNASFRYLSPTLLLIHTVLVLIQVIN